MEETQTADQDTSLKKKLVGGPLSLNFCGPTTIDNVEKEFSCITFKHKEARTPKGAGASTQTHPQQLNKLNPPMKAWWDQPDLSSFKFVSSTSIDQLYISFFFSSVDQQERNKYETCEIWLVSPGF